MKKIMIINDKKIEANLFKTKKAADNFIKKNTDQSIIYNRAHEYYVSNGKEV